ncbi:ABC transporter ATP-binding protein/permease [Candidatus Pelagibacter bacterium]|nr:ABC transporter ATP-binding protein/permease [Candidatus Pelagibacter bacterium]MDC3342391.1 ABC transporter ATP-binding protein/permease [Candidatus Pelagibacter sp.]MDC6478121.1 ABC transporter ATP-binding protein [Candidatus Pelagibacter sp.]
MRKIEIYKRLYKDYSKKYLDKIILSALLSVLVAGSTSAIAWLLDPAIKKLFIEKDQSLIIIIPLMIIIAFTTKGLSLYFAKATMISVGEEIKKKLQFDMINTLIKTDTQIIDKKHSGKFISNLTYDVTHITNLLSNAILTLFKDSLTLIGLLTVMFLQNWKLALISIVMIPLASISAKTLGKRISKVTTEAQEKSGYLTTYLVELFKNHKLIKIFQKENLEINRADEYLSQLKDKNKKIQTVFVRLSPIMEILTGFMVAVLIFYSGKLMSKGEVDINNFFSFLAAMMLAYQPVRSLSTLNMIINQGLSAASRILPVIDQKNEIKNSESAKPLKIKDAGINFNNVNFSYEKNEGPTLQSINLKFEGGKMTSLVGHSGSGKSTILNLIPRIYDAKSGDIIIDDQSIYDSTIGSLRSEISMVSQETTLFDDTIKNNIKYGRQEATDDEVFKVAKLSYCDEFINSLPNKFDTLIGENGVRLSGGEKQRLSIARAMMKQSSIILLDEATSSLDSETESKIQEALKVLTKNKTTIVIAHRLSTILNSNNIYVIDSGKIVDNGKHDDLMISSELYKNFYEKQIQK